MKLSVSNIGWSREYDDKILSLLKDEKFSAIEIAPTTFVSENPYDNINYAKEIVDEIFNKYGLVISSMQSIWYGKTEKIFNKEEAKELIGYTKKAIDYAKSIGCHNLVFGCPKNRIRPDDCTDDDVLYFFKEIGDYAKNNDVIIAIEPNPVIYGTNFINYTKDAFDYVKKIDNNGIKVNIDLGTIIYNKEDLNIIKNNINLVNHIHISEPNLEIIKERNLHEELKNILKETNYDKYVSIEMKKTNDINDLIKSINYVKGMFGDE